MSEIGQLGLTSDNVLSGEQLKQVILKAEENQVVACFDPTSDSWELNLACTPLAHYGDELEDFEEPIVYWFLRPTYWDWTNPFEDWEDDDLQIGDKYTHYHVLCAPPKPTATEKEIEEMI